MRIRDSAIPACVNPQHAKQRSETFAFSLQEASRIQRKAYEKKVLDEICRGRRESRWPEENRVRMRAGRADVVDQGRGCDSYDGQRDDTGDDRVATRGTDVDCVDAGHEDRGGRGGH